MFINVISFRVLLWYQLELVCQPWGDMFLSSKPLLGRSLLKKMWFTALLLPLSTGLLYRYLSRGRNNPMYKLLDRKERKKETVPLFCN